MAPKKKALLIGINDYAPIGQGGPDLRGCVNDVRDMAHTLNALNIVPATARNLQILTDERATKRGILEKLKWLLDDAKAGDLLIFYYSGHGTQVPDINGDDNDRIDEAICPHDLSYGTLIRDDEFRTIFRDLPQGVNLDVMLDSCFSGTGTRSLPAILNPSDVDKIAYRYYEPPVDWSYYMDANPSVINRRLFTATQEKSTKAVVYVPGLNHVLWAACRNNQTSAEVPVEGEWRGAFTSHFCKVLRRAGKEITRRRLDSLVSADLRRDRFTQVPQLEGTPESINQKIFT